MADIVFDRAKANKLADAIKTAEAKGNESFVFEGQTTLVRYAKYTVQYLDSQLKTEPK